ncbi:MAG: hypothetical protein QS748_14795, partial [Candidatus Endonucleobacter bathymodioli]|nr:hypothetical protein [Candidatus Endonucleobacter bathymodioli]
AVRDSLELKRCHLGAYDAGEVHRHSLRRRKTATKFHKNGCCKSAGEVQARLRLYTLANCRTHET